MATAQDEFLREVRRRFREVRGATRKTIVDNDALRLKGSDDGPRHPRDLVNVDPAQSFDFQTDAERIQAFNAWFDDAVDRGILEQLDREDVIAGRHFTAPYMDSSYEKGLTWADKQLAEVGFEVGGTSIDAVMQLPNHRDALQTLYTRSYRQLNGITTDMESEISRLMTNELAAGAGPRRIARELTGSIRTFEKTRANVFARTEVMNAFAQANGERFKQYGVEQVDILTHQPCNVCADARDSGPYPVSEAQSMLPFHPNCVCTMQPHRTNVPS